MPRWMATEEDEHEGVQRLLVGLSSGQDVFELSATISELHQENDTFPGEVYVRLAARGQAYPSLNASRSAPDADLRRTGHHRGRTACEDPSRRNS